MKPDGEIASEILDRMSDLLNYELLVSTPGIKEPDSDFMWATKFRAPVSINVIRDEVSFNLFLPEGSENDKDKKLFFNRVGAKLEDGLWQVRRDMKDLSEVYANIIKMAVGSFNSVILDYSFIKEGRYYSHFTFNESDLADISTTLISLVEVIHGYRIEYIRKMGSHSSIFNGIEEIGEVSTVSIEISYGHGENGQTPRNSEMLPFLMASFLNGGVKTISGRLTGPPPKILSPSSVEEISDGIVSFKSENRHIIDLVQAIASNFIILYGLYGMVRDEFIRLMVPIPKQQTSALLKVLNGLMDGTPDWNIRLCEISRFSQNGE